MDSIKEILLPFFIFIKDRVLLLLRVRIFAEEEVDAFIQSISPEYAPFWHIIYTALSNSIFYGGYSYLNPTSWGRWSLSGIIALALLEVAWCCYFGTKEGWSSKNIMVVVGSCFKVMIYCLAILIVWWKYQQSKRRRRLGMEPEVKIKDEYPQHSFEDKRELQASDLNEKGT
ncbi:hypothetical protein N7448_001001 [Penicillium atrosanguineum]|uniref:uncharacterized protein n=1 Tax=Penicillium atrosanguineum TaxID=1132637 RepID=UPI0023963E8D|nr:uncharacterized protein N7443_004399 [Penicillium atrosanguineum]KAJ5149423.1 hypothetical protein N7448_001001 [Penicillium atrosanguineum]KAJ5304739.1 hypothetical protein N7443_004399 [Penicillium atrosanguineum]